MRQATTCLVWRAYNWKYDGVCEGVWRVPHAMDAWLWGCARRDFCAFHSLTLASMNFV